MFTVALIRYPGSLRTEGLQVLRQTLSKKKKARHDETPGVDRRPPHMYMCIHECARAHKHIHTRICIHTHAQVYA